MLSWMGSIFYINSMTEIINESGSDQSKLSPEAQKRVDAVVNAALKIIESTPELWNAIQETFNQMVDHNMRNPESVQKLLDGLYEKHKEHTKDLDPNQKLVAEKSFTKFMETFSQNLAHMHRDIDWSNELNAIKYTFESKRKSITTTYASIIQNEKIA